MGRKQGESIGDLKKRLSRESKQAPDPAREAFEATREAGNAINGEGRTRRGMRRASKLHPGPHKG